jgi:hypothetical protein
MLRKRRPGRLSHATVAAYAVNTVGSSDIIDGTVARQSCVEKAVTGINASGEHLLLCPHWNRRPTVVRPPTRPLARQWARAGYSAGDVAGVRGRGSRVPSTLERRR